MKKRCRHLPITITIPYFGGVSSLPPLSYKQTYCQRTRTMPDLPIPLVTGYYRYTDIMFEWHKTVDDPAEVSALKAFLSTSALGSDEHPFRQESKKGLQLFIGEYA